MNALEVALAAQEQRVRRTVLQHTFRPFVPCPPRPERTPDFNLWDDPAHEGNTKANKYKCPCPACVEQRRLYERGRRQRNREKLQMVRGAYRRKEPAPTSAHRPSEG